MENHKIPTHELAAEKANKCLTSCHVFDLIVDLQQAAASLCSGLGGMDQAPQELTSPPTKSHGKPETTKVIIMKPNLKYCTIH